MVTEIGRKILELRKGGMSLKKIQKKLNCSKSTISKWCSTLENNEEIKKKNIESLRKIITKEDIKKREIEILRTTKPDNPSWFSDYKARLRESTKAFLIHVAGGGCCICGYDKASYNLSFHHIDPLQKCFEINGMRLTYNIDYVIKEASKCTLVCLHCHGELNNGVDHKVKAINFDDVEIPNSMIEWFLSFEG